MTWRVVSGSCGSFLDPPGHPSHRWEVREGPANNPHSIMSLVGALEAEYVPEKIKEQVRALFADATLVRSEQWEAHVYGYFKNCYSPDGTNRNVQACIIGKDAGPPKHHLAYLLVRRHFESATPRPDLIESGGTYGTQPCLGCGVTVQYEAKIDGWMPSGGARLCIDDQPHRVGAA